MKWSSWIRQAHRWVSVAFTVTVILNFAALKMDEATRMKLAFLPLLPLALLFFSGAYLFLLPYLAKWRSGRNVEGA